MSRAGDTGLKVKGGAQLISSENNRAKIHQSGWEKLAENKTEGQCPLSPTPDTQALPLPGVFSRVTSKKLIGQKYASCMKLVISDILLFLKILKQRFIIKYIFD